MKYFYKQIFLSLALAAVFIPSTVFADESIQQMTVSIKVNQDSPITVQEKIKYDFGDEPRHGIYRDIPHRYERNGFNFNLRISDITVTDDSGIEYDFSKSSNNPNLQLKIGDPDTTISGVHTYVINYKVERALNFFDDHDELYWNAVGWDWTVPMNNVSVSVELPVGVDQANISIACFAGPYGGTQPCSNKGEIKGNIVNFYEPSLPLQNGLSAVVGWPKGVVVQPTKWQTILGYVVDNKVFFIPIFGFFAMFYVWHRYGKDPQPSVPLVAQYEAPSGLTPIEAGFLVDERNQNTEITAEIIYLATLGYLKIERIPKKGLFSKEDYKFYRIKKEGDLKNAFDRGLMASLFQIGGDEVELSDLKTKLSGKLKTGDIPKKLTQDGYYEKNPTNIRNTYLAVGGVAGFILMSLFTALAALPGLIALLGLCATILLFGYFMAKKTQKGADTRQLLLGLKQYLSVAEKDRLDFHNDPAKDPKLFEKLLPYAMVLGVSNQWSEKFKGVFDYQPTWYVDPTHAMFNAIAFNSSINSFSGTFQSVAHTSTAGSGGSGFGGGGFSGGGGGGGGGGSW